MSKIDNAPTLNRLDLRHQRLDLAKPAEGVTIARDELAIAKPKLVPGKVIAPRLVDIDGPGLAAGLATAAVVAAGSALGLAGGTLLAVGAAAGGLVLLGGWLARAFKP